MHIMKTPPESSCEASKVVQRARESGRESVKEVESPTAWSLHRCDVAGRCCTAAVTAGGRTERETGAGYDRWLSGRYADAGVGVTGSELRQELGGYYLWRTALGLDDLHQ
ncbi:hypothetical protein F444_03720 [Phytophthora nicotianae P1976]|uniref:Uncharacterized protein n=1 Tax=Phytophthora nicotianae P1976 TaxID=1317066 RepID=A0A081AT39_PHYNI|nr:hypothetical protein F444_03720 [Phytophthora nicotianae P1976]